MGDRDGICSYIILRTCESHILFNFAFGVGSSWHIFSSKCQYLRPCVCWLAIFCKCWSDFLSTNSPTFSLSLSHITMYKMKHFTTRNSRCISTSGVAFSHFFCDCMFKVVYLWFSISLFRSIFCFIHVYLCLIY